MIRYLTLTRRNSFTGNSVQIIQFVLLIEKDHFSLDNVIIRIYIDNN